MGRRRARDLVAESAAAGAAPAYVLDDEEPDARGDSCAAVEAPSTRERLADLFEGLTSMPPLERSQALDEFLGQLGAAILRGDEDEILEARSAFVKDLTKIRRLLVRDEDRRRQPVDDDAMEALTAPEWTGTATPAAEAMAKAAATAGVGCEQLLRERRAIDLAATTSAPPVDPAELERLNAAGGDA